MGLFLLAYLIGIGVLTYIDPYWGAMGILGSVVLGAIIGIMTFCTSWKEVLIGVPIGLLLCLCATV